MIAWFMRRRCAWCRCALYSLCHTHNERAKVWRRWLTVVALMLVLESANVLAWRWAGRRWLP